MKRAEVIAKLKPVQINKGCKTSIRLVINKFQVFFISTQDPLSNSSLNEKSSSSRAIIALEVRLISSYSKILIFFVSFSERGFFKQRKSIEVTKQRPVKKA
jgi:hypothetical protein